MLKVLAALYMMLIFASVLSGAVPGAVFYAVEGDKSPFYSRMLKQELGKTGFVLSDPQERINDAYEEKYGVSILSGKPNAAYDPEFKVTLDYLGFFPISNDTLLLEWLPVAPKLGAFSPFNLLVFKRSDENRTYVGHLAPEAMLEIAGVKETKIRHAFIDAFTKLDALIAPGEKGRVTRVPYAVPAVDPMMEFELTFDRSDSLNDFVDAFQERFEAAFEAKQYVIAGYKSFTDTYENAGAELKRYDRYWVYALCHFSFSYSIFNKGNPEAAVFAPCSVYMYIEKGSNILHIGMSSLENWAPLLGPNAQGQLQKLRDINAEISEIMTKRLGAKRQ